MKIIKKFLFVFVVVFIQMNASCATTPKSGVKSEKSAESAYLEKGTSKKKDAEVSPEVKFVESLNSVLENGTGEDALALFEKMPENTKNDAQIQTLKASLLLSTGKIEEAETLASALLEKDPKNLDVLELSMMIAKDKGDSEKKAQVLRQILAIDPKNAGANVELGSEQALRRNYRNARDFFKTASLSEPENIEALFGLGKMSYYLTRDDESKKSFKKILELDPENSEALSYLGKFEAESRNYKKAKEYILQAIKYDDKNADYYFDLGSYSRFMGDYAGAEEAWKVATELDPDYFLGYAYLAGLYDEQNKPELAYQNYKKVIEKNPKYYYAYEALGMLAWHKGNYAESRNAFQLARKYKPDNMSYPLMVAACFQKEKNPMECRKYTEAVWKNMDRNSLEYFMIRLFHDMGGDGAVTLKVQNEQNKTKRAKMLFYLAVYFDLKGNTSLAQKYYLEVANLQGAMFFEYKLACWASGKNIE